jgi:hypothetical protein
MKRIVATLSLFLAACGEEVTTVNLPGPGPTPAPDSCQIVPPTDFSVIPEGWQKGAWMTVGHPTPDTIAVENGGVTFTGVGSNSRASLIKSIEKDVSNCIHFKIVLRGKIMNQSLQSSGMDDREAPLAVMVDYTDTMGVRHNSLNAYNEGEPDDRNTTRMFWSGFTLYDMSTAYPNTTPMVRSVLFKDAWFTKAITAGISPKIIHSVAIESSGWNPRKAVIKHFLFEAMEHPVHPF